MLTIRPTTRYRRELKAMAKRGYDMKLLNDVIRKLQNREQLPPENRDHALERSRNYKDARECHIKPDWLLVYRVLDDVLVLELLHTGTHSDLF